MNRKILMLLVTLSLVALVAAGWTWDDGRVLGSLLGL